MLDIAFSGNVVGFADDVTGLDDNNLNIEVLSQIMNEKFDQKRFELIQEDTSSFKLSNEIRYRVRKDKKESIFWEILFEEDSNVKAGTRGGNL